LARDGACRPDRGGARSAGVETHSTMTRYPRGNRGSSRPVEAPRLVVSTCGGVGVQGDAQTRNTRDAGSERLPACQRADVPAGRRSSRPSMTGFQQEWTTRVVAASQPTLHRGAAIFAATRRRPRARCSARAYGSRPRQPPARDQPRVRTANRPRLLADRAKVPSVVLRLAQSTALALPATQRHSAELNQGSTSRTARN
jgi:hypothetical protein